VDVEAFAAASVEEGLYYLAFVRLPELAITEVRKVRVTVDASGRMADALALMAAGDVPAAETILTALVGAVPRLRLVRHRLGECRRIAGDSPGAERWYREELAAFPDSVDAWAGLGLLARTRGDSPAALAALEKALQLDPTHLTATLTLGALVASGSGPEGPAGGLRPPSGPGKPGPDAERSLALIARAYSLYPRSEELRAFLRASEPLLGRDLSERVRLTGSPLRFC
jgi:tetratricopeptide (TPR) repeat protein